MTYLIAVDVGTSNTKTALYYASGLRLGEVSEEYALSRPSPSWAEIDAEAWWRAVCVTARSAAWCQIKADVIGKPFVVACQADGSQGGHTLRLFAMLAQAGGLCCMEELPEFVEGLLPLRQVYEPVPARHAMYNELFAVYAQLSAKLKEDFCGLAGVVAKYQLESICLARFRSVRR